MATIGVERGVERGIESKVESKVERGVERGTERAVAVPSVPPFHTFVKTETGKTLSGRRVGRQVEQAADMSQSPCLLVVKLATSDE